MRDQPNRTGVDFKPWPMANFLGSLLGVAVLFVVERILPPDYLSYPGLVGASMAAMALAYMNYCGYSLWTSPARVKFNLVAMFIGILLVLSALTSILLKG